MKKCISLSWGTRVALLYSTFVIGTLSWAGYAMSRDVDLVRPDYYEYSLQHDATMRAQENANALGSAASVNVEATQIVIQLPKTMTGVTGTVALYRPNSMKQDRNLPLTLDASGAMTIARAGLAEGRWEITVQWKSGNTSYELNRRAEL